MQSKYKRRCLVGRRSGGLYWRFKAALADHIQHQRVQILQAGPELGEAEGLVCGHPERCQVELLQMWQTGHSGCQLTRKGNLKVVQRKKLKRTCAAHHTLAFSRCVVVSP